jgi:hypothetical protein
MIISLSLTDRYLDDWLHGETTRPRKQHPTAKHIHQGLVQMLAHNWMQSNKKYPHSGYGLY